VQAYSPRNVVHAFRLHLPDEIDDEFAAWLAEAYEVGAQHHPSGGRQTTADMPPTASASSFGGRPEAR
jgi:hypothetical protein